MKRREFLKAGAAAVGGAVATGGMAAASSSGWRIERRSMRNRFRLNYAPHFGMFRHSAGRDLVDQLKFAADQGFGAWEDNAMRARPVATQRRIARAMQALGMQMGIFVGTAAVSEVTFAGTDRARREAVLRDLRDSVNVARRLRARWLAVVPGGADERLGWDRQAANCVELLKRCRDLLVPQGLVMVLEPRSGMGSGAGCFLRDVGQAFQICRRVGSPACKILLDTYHQAHVAGDLIGNLGQAWSEIAYVQCGSHPGRKEPGTDAVDYREVFRSLCASGYGGIVGMEHGNSRPGAAGERAVIEAYARADRF